MPRLDRLHKEGLRNLEEVCSTPLANTILSRKDVEIARRLPAETRDDWLRFSLKDASLGFGFSWKQLVRLSPES
jgi:hypothetical protein